jgi:parallel beta-helix repeat protein
MEKNHISRKCLAIGIILLFVGTCIVPAIAQDVEKPLPSSRGDWLYVGGDGPGNYTKIQDAINDSIDGDTVYVYNGTYFEYIVVDKSINLIGGEKTTTIIDGINGNGFYDFCITIEANNVTVTGLTIRNSKFTGIYISSDYNIITDNIVVDNRQGIAIIGEFGGNIISHNLILNNNKSGGLIVLGRNNNVSENIISQSGWYGIYLDGVDYSNISNNIISENENGIYTGITFHNIFYRNNISNNKRLGVEIFCTSFDRFIQNTFIGNGRNVYFIQPVLLRIKYLRILNHNTLQPTVWDGNYWDGQRIMPYPILGLTTLWDYLGRISLMYNKYLFDSFQVDWHPAQKPYDIPGMR